MKNLMSFKEYNDLNNYKFTVEDISNLIAIYLSGSDIVDEWLGITEDELCTILEDIDDEDEIEVTDITVDFPTDTDNDIEILEPYDRKDAGLEENVVSDVYNKGKGAGESTRAALGKVTKKGWAFAAIAAGAGVALAALLAYRKRKSKLKDEVKSADNKDELHKEIKDISAKEIAAKDKIKKEIKDNKDSIKKLDPKKQEAIAKRAEIIQKELDKK
jgi:hypothetical protein